MKASIGSKFKVPSALFCRYSTASRSVESEIRNVREIVKGLVHARDIEYFPFLSPHASHFPFRDGPASGFVRIPDFPTRFGCVAHASLISPAIRAVEGAEQGSIEPVRGGTEGGQQGWR